MEGLHLFELQAEGSQSVHVRLPMVRDRMGHTWDSVPGPCSSFGLNRPQSLGGKGFIQGKASPNMALPLG